MYTALSYMERPMELSLYKWQIIIIIPTVKL